MATIRRRGVKWQVQFRRVGFSSVSRSFNVLKDAQAWARLMEVQADRRDLPNDPRALQQVTLGQLVERYRARIDTLSEFRNGTFHYQRDHEKQLQFLGDESSRVASMNWAALLHEEFRQYFVERLAAPEDWGLP